MMTVNSGQIGDMHAVIVGGVGVHVASEAAHSTACSYGSIRIRMD